MKQAQWMVRLAAGTALALAAVSAAAAGAAEPMRFLFVADTGYIPSYEKVEKPEDRLATHDAYLAAEARDWLERNVDLSTFRPTPGVFEAARGTWLAASGLYPVARAGDEVCRRDGCAFAVMAGDNIYPDGATLGADGIDDARRYADMLDRPYGQLGAGVPDFTIYALMGNHDWRISRAATLDQMRYFQTHPNFTMPGLFYAVKPPAFKGAVELFVVDTEMLLASTSITEYDVGPDGVPRPTGKLEKRSPHAVPVTAEEKDMVGWLDRALASSTARWKIVIGHHALWSGGGSKGGKAEALRRMLMPSLCRHADAYMNGDDHVLEAYTDDCAGVTGRLAPPLPLLTAGAGGKQRPLNPNFIKHQLAEAPGVKGLWHAGSVWGFMHITLDGDALAAQFYTTPNDQTGRPVAEAGFRFTRRNR